MPLLSVRNPSLLQAGLGHLVRSITAAKYILTTLTVLSITWTPWLLTLSYGIIINKNSHHNASLNYKVNMIRKFSIQQYFLCSLYLYIYNFEYLL